MNLVSIAPHQHHPRPMRSRVLLGVLLGALLAVGILPQRTPADLLTHPWTPHPTRLESWVLQPSFQVIHSQSNRGPQAEILSPKDLALRASFWDLTVTAPWPKPGSIFLRATLSHLSLKSESGSAERLGFADQSIGFQYPVDLSPSWKARIQLQADLPAYGNLQTGPSLGDGALGGTIGGFLESPLLALGRFKAQGLVGIGWNSRTHLYSASIPWIFSLKLSLPSSSLEILPSILGLTSLRSDPYSYVPDFHRSNLGQTGSLLSGAMNPSWAEAQLKLSFPMNDQVNLLASGHQTLWGQMTAQLTRFALAIQIPFDTSTEKLPQPPAHPEVPWKTTDLESPRSNPQNTANSSLPPSPQTGQVVKINSRLGLLKIDLGEEEGVRAGDHFQILPSTHPTEETLAIARVIESRKKVSALEILEYLKNSEIREGFYAVKITSE